MTGKLGLTLRDFYVIRFYDSNGQKCRLQESSSVEPKIWLGTQEASAHLTQEQVRDLLPCLRAFAEDGDMGKFCKYQPTAPETERRNRQC